MSLDGLNNPKWEREDAALLEGGDGFIKLLNTQETAGVYDLYGILRAKWHQ